MKVLVIYQNHFLKNLFWHSAISQLINKPSVDCFFEKEEDLLNFKSLFGDNFKPADEINGITYEYAIFLTDNTKINVKAKKKVGVFRNNHDAPKILATFISSSFNAFLTSVLPDEIDFKDEELAKYFCNSFVFLHPNFDYDKLDDNENDNFIFIEEEGAENLLSKSVKKLLQEKSSRKVSFYNCVKDIDETLSKSTKFILSTNNPNHFQIISSWGYKDILILGQGKISPLRLAMTSKKEILEHHTNLFRNQSLRSKISVLFSKVPKSEGSMESLPLIDFEVLESLQLFDEPVVGANETFLEWTVNPCGNLYNSNAFNCFETLGSYYFYTKLLYNNKEKSGYFSAHENFLNFTQCIYQLTDDKRRLTNVFTDLLSKEILTWNSFFEVFLFIQKNNFSWKQKTIASTFLFKTCHSMISNHRSQEIKVNNDFPQNMEILLSTSDFSIDDKYFFYLSLFLYSSEIALEKLDASVDSDKTLLNLLPRLILSLFVINGNSFESTIYTLLTTLDQSSYNPDTRSILCLSLLKFLNSNLKGDNCLDSISWESVDSFRSLHTTLPFSIMMLKTSELWSDRFNSNQVSFLSESGFFSAQDITAFIESPLTAINKLDDFKSLCAHVFSQPEEVFFRS